MKITKQELAQIIKEEAQRFMAIKKLESEKAEIERQLNESYMEEEIDEMEEGFLGDVGKKIGGALQAGASAVQKAAASKIISPEQKAAGKKMFDEKMAKLKSEIQSKGFTDDRIITVDTNGKQIQGLDEKSLNDAAEQYAYQGYLNYGLSKSSGKVVVSFVEGSLTGAGGQGGGKVVKTPELKKEETISESVIRQMIKEEAEKIEKAKALKARANQIKEELKNL
jgi:hypothetical protein